MIEDAKSGRNPLREDKVYMIKRSAKVCEEGISKFRFDKALHSQYVEVGFELFRQNGDWSIYDEAMKQLNALKLRTLEPEVDRYIYDFSKRYEAITSGFAGKP